MPLYLWRRFGGTPEAEADVIDERKCRKASRLQAREARWSNCNWMPFGVMGAHISLKLLSALERCPPQREFR